MVYSITLIYHKSKGYIVARRYKSNPETENSWVAFLIVLILYNILSATLPNYEVVWLWVCFFSWIALCGLFSFLDERAKNKQKSTNITTNNSVNSRISDSSSASRVSVSKNKDNYTHEVKEKLFNEYIEKETDRIIKDNNLSDYKDKQAARMIAINNTKHSPEIMSDVWNLPIATAKEVEESISIQEEKKIANHTAYEGRISNKDKNKLKSVLGYKCEACGTDMSAIYGNIGQNYIELHHKIPYSDMKENEIRILTDKEFCVLCPNCHRMIHKLPNAGDIDLLTRIIKLNRKTDDSN